MLNILKPIWLPFIKFGALIFGILLVLLKVRQSGKQSEQQEQINKTLKEVQTRDKIEQDVNNSNDAEQLRLKDKWTR